jgi:aminocarboxymuconate-semialdehyde decarboxylase
MPSEVEGVNRAGTAHDAATGFAAIDSHAHFFGSGPAHRRPLTDDPRWPYLVVQDDGSGVIMCGDTVFRRVQRSLWSVPDRLAELDAVRIERQVISPVPVTLTYWAPVEQALQFSRAVNDAIAEASAASEGRLIGLGTVPLQDVPSAVAELERLAGELGLRGVEIGACVEDRELDHPDLLPFFEAAQALGAAIFVHPLEGGANAVRRRGQPYDFGLGMLTDTAMAAGALVFGGVLERCPKLRIALAHGCGTFAWAYPRLRLAAQAFLGQDAERVDQYTRSLWVDALVFDPSHLGLLISRFGAGRVMLGTDHPFVPGQLAAGRYVIDAAIREGSVPADLERGILGGNVLEWLRLQ